MRHFKKCIIGLVFVILIGSVMLCPISAYARMVRETNDDAISSFKYANLAAFYDELMDFKAHKRMGFWYWNLNFKETRKLLLETLNIKPGDKILEIGPGGTFLSLFCAWLGAEVTVVETPKISTFSFFKALVNRFKHRIKGRGNLEIVYGDITESKIQEEVVKNGPYDHVFALDVLRPDPIVEHMGRGREDPYEGIHSPDSVNNVISLIINLKEPFGGTIYISHPDSDSTYGFREIKKLDEELSSDLRFRGISITKQKAPIPRTSDEVGIVYHFSLNPDRLGGLNW